MRFDVNALTLVEVQVYLPSCRLVKDIPFPHDEDIASSPLAVSDAWHEMRLLPRTEHQAQGSRTIIAVARDLLLLQRGLECGFAEGRYGLTIDSVHAGFDCMGMKRVVRALGINSPSL